MVKTLEEFRIKKSAFVIYLFLVFSLLITSNFSILHMTPLCHHHSESEHHNNTPDSSNDTQQHKCCSFVFQYVLPQTLLTLNEVPNTSYKLRPELLISWPILEGPFQPPLQA